MTLLCVFHKVDLLFVVHVIVAGLINLRCFFWTISSFTVHKQFLGKTRNEEEGNFIFTFFPKKGSIKITCATVEVKDSESLRTMAGIPNFRTVFESLGKNWDLLLTKLSTIHL